jgi:hypothetical protein
LIRILFEEDRSNTTPSKPSNSRIHVANLALLIYAAAVLAALLYARRSGLQGLLQATAFLIPWFGLQRDFGVTINADRSVSVFLLIVLIARYGAGAGAFLSPFYAYLVLDTALASINLPSAAREFSSAKGEWRWLFQLAMWAVLIAPGAALARLASWDSARRTLRVLLMSASILAFIALVQVATFYATGVDILPMHPFYGGELQSGSFYTESFAGRNVFRASSLGGEPKHLAYSLSIGLTVLLGDWVFGGPLQLTRRQIGLAAVLLSIAILATFSTQGFVLLGLNATLLLMLGALARGNARRMMSFGLAAVAVALLVGLVPDFAGMLYERSAGRLIETGGAEDTNQAVWSWLQATGSAWLFGVGVGNVHLYAFPFVPEEYLSYMQGGVFVAKAGLLRLLSELGIVGLGFFLGAFWTPLRKLAGQARRGSAIAGYVGALTTTVLCDFMISCDGPVYVFLFAGAAVGVSLDAIGAKDPAVA